MIMKQNTIWQKAKAGMLILAATVIFNACGPGRQDVSPTTGWAYNDPETGNFEVLPHQEQEVGPGLVFIEGGTFVMGRTVDDVMFDWNNIPRRVTVSSFFMDETEIRNVDYLEYLHWTNRIYGDVLPEKYRNALPDTLVWRDPLAYNEPYVENYLRHPAFKDYPVVGVSWVQASEYARWRTDRVNEMILVREGYLEYNFDEQTVDNHFTTDRYLAGQDVAGEIGDAIAEGMRRARWEDGLMLPRYRLPTEAEWEYAALGLIGHTVDEQVLSRRMYPWSGTGLRSTARRTEGKFLANFQRGPGDLSGIAGYPNPGGDITMPVKSFPPNDFGLYNMAGNVNEWVKDVYRPLSHETVADFRPFRGNIFRVPELDPDGNPVFDEDGRIMMQPLEDFNEEDEPRRDDHRQGDFISHRDGDDQSAIAEGMDVYASNMTLISDSIRVYKGGSWRDRSYWLSPGTRRFLHQEHSRNDIGFRCAMDLIGPGPGN